MGNGNNQKTTDEKGASHNAWKRHHGGYGGLLVAILVLLLIVGGVLFAWRSGMLSFSGSMRHGYQAVFLTNGQVYFGKVKNVKSAYIVVKDIYYLQQRQRLQEPQSAEGEGASTTPELTLVKLGQELHGPEDAMEINRSHILFIENLKEEGKVVQAIKRYKEEQK